MDGQPASAETVVTAVSPRGEVVGCFIVAAEGNYGSMYIYGYDTTVDPPIPGMQEGEDVTFKVNGWTAQTDPALTWQNDHAFHEIDLAAEEGSIFYFPLILQ